MTHYPSLFRHWFHVFVKYKRRPPKRYREILRYIALHDVQSILEIGVYTGVRAIEMITASAIRHARPDIRYDGFDLFEEMTPDLCAKEFSKMPQSEKNIYTALAQTGATIQLWKGFSQDTLPRYVASHPQPIDLIFIDGGHAIDTITSDWQNVKKLMGKRTMVIFDDYYCNPDTEVKGIGCQTLIDALDRKTYNVSTSTTTDHFRRSWGTLKIKLAFVSLTHV